MSEEDYDICIVGGGLAGSVLASNLSPQFDLCIVEKKRIDDLGSDPCGNAVHRSWFDSDGIAPTPPDFGAVCTEADSIFVHLDGERWRADLSPERRGLVIDKEKYVKGALESALDLGTDFIRGNAKPVFEDGKVRKLKADGTAIEARVYVDASGMSAVLRNNFLSVPKGAFFQGYREILDHGLSQESWHVFQDDPDSVFWAVPMGSRTNIGGAVFRDGVRLKRDIKRLKSRLGFEGTEILEADFGSIPSYRPIELVHGNTVAIGDAGFTVNPITGGGMGPTVRSANILAETFKNGENLENFQHRYLQEVASGYEKNYLLSRFLLSLQPFFWKRVARWALKKFYGGTKVEE